MIEASEHISVLYVEDDARTASLISKYLESHGLSVTIVTNGSDGLAVLSQRSVDAILLDVMLPGIDGVSLCRTIRTRFATPIIMVTARGEEADRVMGLETGADDYLVKPFSMRELLARIRSQCRRAGGRVGPPACELRVGQLLIDPAAMVATYAERPLSLTTYEFVLLRALAERPYRVLSREQLIELVRGTAEDAFDRSIDIHISHLRQKLGDNPRQPRLLKTVRGVGYMLAPERQ